MHDMFVMREMVGLIASHLYPRELFLWLGAMKSVREVLKLSLDTDGWLRYSGLCEGVKREISEGWPTAVVSALDTLLDSGRFGITGSLLLDVLNREDGSNRVWRDLDLVGPCNDAAVADIRTFLNAVHPFVWSVNKSIGARPDQDHPLDETPSVTWARNNYLQHEAIADDVKKLRTLLQPIDSFLPLFGYNRNGYVRLGYSRHRPTVCYSIYLIDDKTRARCTHVDTEDLGSATEDSACCAEHLPSIDLMMVIDDNVHDLNSVFSWISNSFDFDICANLVAFPNGLPAVQRSFNPLAIFNRRATFRGDQYCLVPTSATLEKKEMPDRFSRNEIRRNYFVLSDRYGRCRCAEIVLQRIKKYALRRYEISVAPLKKPVTAAIDDDVLTSKHRRHPFDDNEPHNNHPPLKRSKTLSKP